MADFGAALLGIVVINLLLSGDNAIVIGMAARGLPGRQKRQAIIFGGVGALVLRVLLTALATILFQIPLLEALGGLVLAWITYRLLVPSADDSPGARAQSLSFAAALRTIIVADLTMSLDNVLAVGAVAQGDILLLLIGLSLSMGIIMAGGGLVAVLLERMSWLVYIGAVVLLLVAGSLLAEDPWIQGVVGHEAWLAWAFAAVLGLGVALALGLRHLRERAREDPQRGKSGILKV